MTLFLGAVGWGLFAAGAVTHLAHFGRLRELLTTHTQHADALARVLVAAEAAIAVSLPVAFFGGWETVTTALAIGAAAIGVGFTAWVLRLFVSKSGLPCACSFSSAPTTVWSVLRSASTVLVGFFAIASSSRWGDDVATLASGAAAAMAIFVAPDALAWPPFAKNMRDYARRTNAGGARAAS